jgi:hypothetical protein
MKQKRKIKINKPANKTISNDMHIHNIPFEYRWHVVAKFSQVLPLIQLDQI